ncbi:unnamed protein product, partial [Prorocentrum cordatum]
MEDYNAVVVDAHADHVPEIMRKLADPRYDDVSVRHPTRSPGSSDARRRARLELVFKERLLDMAMEMRIRDIKRHVLDVDSYIGLKSLYTDPDALVLECVSPLAVARVSTLCSQLIFLTSDRALIRTAASKDTWEKLMNDAAKEDEALTITSLRWKAGKYGGRHFATVDATVGALTASRRRRHRRGKPATIVDHITEIRINGEVGHDSKGVINRLLQHACQTQALNLQPARDSERPEIGTSVHLLDLNPTAPPGHARFYLGSSADVRKVYQALHGQVLQIGSDTVSITVQNDAAEQLYPDVTPDQRSDVPFCLLLRRKLYRDFGVDCPSDIGPSSDSPTDPLVRTLARRQHLPYNGDVSITTWNAQALFAENPSCFKRKSKCAHDLMTSHDIGLWTEAHGTAGGSSVWTNPSACQSWWAPGPTTAAAGVGITVTDKFFALFGQHGNLDLYVLYFRTGSEVKPHDVAAAGLEHMDRLPSFFELREALRRRLSSHIAPRDSALSILGGDMNYVADEQDRINMARMVSSGARDSREEARWDTMVAQPHGLRELHQPCMTYASPNARSRLDRLYCNQEHTHYLDYNMSCAALPWCPELSRHRAVSFRRARPCRDSDSAQPLADHVVDHPDWPSKVALTFGELLDQSPGASRLRKASFLEEAMRTAAAHLDGPAHAASGTLSAEDRLGTTMRFLRASERQSPSAVSSCISRYPALCTLVDNPCDFTGPPQARLRLVRQHALDLARDHALDELNQLHGDLADLPAGCAAHRRRRVHRLIHRLAPGRNCATFAIMDKQGHATTDPSAMASTLRDHWSKVFAAQHTDAALRSQWQHEEADHGTPEDARHLPFNKPSREDFKNALRLSKNSAPGPDGITFR